MAIGRLRHSAVAHLAKCFFWLCLFLTAAIVVCCCCYRPLGQSTSSQQAKSLAPFLNQFSRDKNHATVSAHIVHGGRFHLLHVNLSLAKSRALSIPPPPTNKKKEFNEKPYANDLSSCTGPASLESRDRGPKEDAASGFSSFGFKCKKMHRLRRAGRQQTARQVKCDESRPPLLSNKLVGCTRQKWPFSAVCRLISNGHNTSFLF